MVDARVMCLYSSPARKSWPWLVYSRVCIHVCAGFEVAYLCERASSKA